MTVTPLSTVPLTIIEEILLLALDERAGQFYDMPRSSFDCATIGAALMDLAFHYRVDNDLKQMYIIDKSPTGDGLLDPLLQVMALDAKHHPVTHWLRRFAAEAEPLREKALRRLEARGIVKRENKKIWWMFESRRYPVIDNKEQREVKLRVLGTLLRNEIPEPRDAVIVSLAQACGLFKYILSGHELAAAEARLLLISRMDLIGLAVVKAVEEIEAGIAMASGIH